MITADQIEITSDHMGRTYAVVPDEIARMLAASSRAGWTEYRGIAYGESQIHTAESPAYAAARAVLDAVVAADPPTTQGPTDAHLAEHGHFYGFVVGRSAWDSDQRWWRYPVTSPEHKGLTCSGSIHVDTRRQTVRWSG